MTKKYIDWVRDKDCAFCFAPAPSDPHHYGQRGMGQKASDYLVVPLCRKCHDCFHSTRAIAPFDVERTKQELLKTQVQLLTSWIQGERS